MSPIQNIPERIAYLILLYIHGQLSKQQRKELDAWILKSAENEELVEEAVNI